MDENEFESQDGADTGLRVMNLVDTLPKTTAGRAIGNQLVRSRNLSR